MMLALLVIVSPGKDHWQTVKWILRYLRGTFRMCLCFGSSDPMLDGYTYAHMVGDINSRKFTYGYMMTFAGEVVSWKSRLKKCVALSTTKVEYITTTEASKVIVWMKKVLKELGVGQENFVIFCENHSAIHLGKNPTFDSRTKHIEVQHHWIWDELKTKLFSLEKIHTNENDSDIMTKTLPMTKMINCKKKGGHSGVIFST